MAGSIFSIFDIGVRALYAQQTALSVTGHNIANANTENYVRQRAELREAESINSSPGQLGMGVKVEEIIRIKDEFTDFQLRKQLQTLGYFDTKNGILQQLENIFNEPSDNGLNSVISAFYDSLQDLSNHPETYSARVMVKEQAEALVGVFNSTIANLSELKANINENINFKVAEINALTKEIATLNDQIVKAEVGGLQNANDLRNRRDALVRDLSNMGDVFVREGEDNLLYVQMGDQILVSGVYPVELRTVNTADNTFEIVTKNGNRLNINNGSLKAMFEMRDDVIQKYADDLDKLARTIIKELNNAHVGGIGLTQYNNITSENSAKSVTVPLVNAGLDFPVNGGQFSLSLYDNNGNLKSETAVTVNPFADSLNDIAARINSIAGFSASVTSDNKLSIATLSSSDKFSFVADSDRSTDTSNFLMAMGLNTFFKGKDAATIAVADTIAGDVNKIATGKTLAPGDNSNVMQLIATRNLASTQDATFEDFYSSLIGNLGVERQVNIQRMGTQELIVNTLRERQQSESGVSFDDEAVHLLRYQRGYQAAAKFIQVVDGLITTLIQML
ncbi:MAG: flagellar hook-associated protein FlgK [Candidatus Auribacterota bacterium]|jgi:flagellar hook-associated protein 1 FlgK|nr:flagellar hook-associated protein FlgK [Candidatus Auribacterota bacterium]